MATQRPEEELFFWNLLRAIEHISALDRKTSMTVREICEAYVRLHPPTLFGKLLRRTLPVLKVRRSLVALEEQGFVRKEMTRYLDMEAVEDTQMYSVTSKGKNALQERGGKTIFKKRKK